MNAQPAPSAPTMLSALPNSTSGRLPASATALPLGNVPTDADVIWFGASGRLIGGQPDSRYGWLEWPLAQGGRRQAGAAGVPCIVKALSPGLTAYADTLLKHERGMLLRLQQLQAPSPALVDVGRDDWLVTRFGGLSLQRLPLHVAAGIPGLSRAEYLAAWVYLLRRLQPLADSGVLAIDLYDANVVLPLTMGLAGQLRLNEVALIDHAHTLEAGMDMRRPVWLDSGMERIAPELRSALQHDQDALRAHFAKAGAHLPGYSRMPGEQDAFNRKVWAEYDAPQQLQQVLDGGKLSRDRAMQFAAGTALAKRLGQAGVQGVGPALAQVLARMTAREAQERFATLQDAADALAQAVAVLPLVSAARFETVRAQDLGGAVLADGGADLALDGTYLAAQGCVPEAEEEGTQLAGVIDDSHAGAHLGASGGVTRERDGGQSWSVGQQESVIDGARLDEDFADEAGGEHHAAEGEQTMLAQQLEPETSWHWVYWALGIGAAIGAAWPW